LRILSFWKNTWSRGIWKSYIRNP